MMISALGTGWVLSSCINKASAGGQLEQPSEVNNSSSTGVRGVSPVGADIVARSNRNATFIGFLSCYHTGMDILRRLAVIPAVFCMLCALGAAQTRPMPAKHPSGRHGQKED